MIYLHLWSDLYAEYMSPVHNYKSSIYFMQ